MTHWFKYKKSCVCDYNVSTSGVVWVGLIGDKELINVNCFMHISNVEKEVKVIIM